jgi:AcrR family transcriptional regulator
MPRITAAREQEVRDRIVRASLRVFAEKGFDRTTMQDVVRESGLSVGAIYTYFRSKDELILAGCDLITDQEMGELRKRLAGIPAFRDRAAAAIGFFFDQLDFERETSGGPRLLIEA